MKRGLRPAGRQGHSKRRGAYPRSSFAALRAERVIPLNPASARDGQAPLIGAHLAPVACATGN
jgi:hypothetical protein